MRVRRLVQTERACMHAYVRLIYYYYAVVLASLQSRCRQARPEQCKQLEKDLRLHQSSKFFHSLSITLIFGRMYGALNIDKKSNYCTVWL